MRERLLALLVEVGDGDASGEDRVVLVERDKVSASPGRDDEQRDARGDA